MKKIALFVSMLVVFITVSAQTKIEKAEFKKPTGPVKIKEIAPPSKTPPPPPASTKTTPTTAPAQTAAPVYTVTAARVSIRTGNDNKEFPSKVYVTMRAISDPSNWRTYIQTQLTNEMRINSSTEFGLAVEGAPIPIDEFQKSGLILRLTYEPNFFADAWKIESLSVTLEVKDQHGNLHPTMGSKTITFSNAYGFLNNEYRYLKCITDASLVPLTSVITKNY